MTWDELLAEHQSERIGLLIYGVVRSIIQSTIRRYSPRVYGGSDTWTAEAVEDLTQDFTLRVLIAEGQLEYAMSAGTEKDFRRLLAFQLRRYLAHRRTRTVVDNILERAKSILANPPFHIASKSPLSYTLETTAATYALSLNNAGDLPEITIRRAAVAALSVPRLAVRSGDREPAVYTAENLQLLLIRIAGEVQLPFSIRSLDNILRLVLTPFVGSPLIDIDEVVPATPDLGPEGAALASAAAHRLAAKLAPEQAMIFLRKLANEADQDIATVLGISRPTLAKRKKELYTLLAEELSGLPSDTATAAVSRLSEFLTEQ